MRRSASIHGRTGLEDLTESRGCPEARVEHTPGLSETLVLSTRGRCVVKPVFKSSLKDAYVRTLAAARSVGKMPHGAFRRAFLLGPFTIKVPRLRFVLHGLRCNRWEREMWYRWRPVFGWESLCPILFADALGLVVVMPRVQQPVTLEEIEAAVPVYFPEPTYETKAEAFGLVNGRVLALDYGLPERDIVSEMRGYYADMSRR